MDSIHIMDSISIHFTSLVPIIQSWSPY